jgi:hypothetical protein
MLRSRKHSLRVTQVTLTKLSFPTMTLEAATPAPINISGASVSAEDDSTFTRPHSRQWPECLRQYPWGPRYSLQPPNRAPGSRCGSTAAAAVRVSAGISPPTPRTRIVGRITAFIPAVATIASPVGSITAGTLPSTDGCTFLRTTLIATPVSSYVIPLTPVSPGITSDRLQAARPLSQTFRLLAT